MAETHRDHSRTAPAPSASPGRLQFKAKAIACASTGNAASSCACSAAVAGLPCFIFVAKFVPQGKLAQLLAYGATVFRVQGTYAQAYDLCNQACSKFGWYNRNAAINPYLVEGKKTGGMEMAEQLADDPPEWVSASVGDGCSIAGVHKGIASMKAVGITDWSAKMLGVQAAGCDPVARAFETGKLDRSGKGDTYADSINVAIPRNWRKAVNCVRDSGGAYVAATDEEIMQAVRADRPADRRLRRTRRRDRGRGHRRRPQRGILESGRRRRRRSSPATA